MKDSLPSACIIGIGNTIRSDDGVGPYICSLFDSLDIPGIHTNVVQQLDAELAEDLQAYDHVILVDASIKGDDVELYQLNESDLTPLASSHHVNASMLMALAKKIYNYHLPLWICAVKGKNFEVGDNLSPEAEANAIKAVKYIQDKLRELGISCIRPSFELVN